MTRHDLDLFSLLSGLVLTGIALAALFDVGPEFGPWLWPTVLIAIGVIVLATVVGSGRSAGDDGPVDDPEHTDAVAAPGGEVGEADHTAE